MAHITRDLIELLIGETEARKREAEITLERCIGQLQTLQSLLDTITAQEYKEMFDNAEA